MVSFLPVQQMAVWRLWCSSTLMACRGATVYTPWFPAYWDMRSSWHSRNWTSFGIQCMPGTCSWTWWWESVPIEGLKQIVKQQNTSFFFFFSLLLILLFSTLENSNAKLPSQRWSSSPFYWCYSSDPSRLDHSGSCECSFPYQHKSSPNHCRVPALHTSKDMFDKLVLGCQWIKTFYASGQWGTRNCW